MSLLASYCMSKEGGTSAENWLGLLVMLAQLMGAVMPQFNLCHNNGVPAYAGRHFTCSWQLYALDLCLASWNLNFV